MGKTYTFFARYLHSLLILLLAFTLGCEKNQAPIIQNIIVNQVEMEAGESTTLSASVEDPDGDVLIYLWEADDGQITSENNLAGITWKAPMNQGNSTLRVSVNDGINIVTDSVQITVVADPVIHLDKESILFDGSKTQEFFNIENTGSGLLNWNIQFSTDDGGDWIKSVTPGEGSTAQNEPTTIEVNVDRTGMPGGRYFGSVNISSNDQDASIQVIMDVAQLIISPTELDFGSTATSKNLIIRNAGSETIDFNLIVSENWISVNPKSGQAGSQATNISVEVDRSGLNPGLYSGQIIVSSELGDITVGVGMEVKNDPILFVNTTSLDFGTTINSRMFFIQNSGGGTLTWNISENLNWLEVSPANGSTTSETDNITLVADRSRLNPGINEGIISINSNGGNAEIEVVIENIQAPVLSVSDTEMDFGTSSTSKKFTINNSGGGTLSWSINENLSWMTVNPSSGTTTTETDEIMVIVSRSDLAAGDHSGTISITSNGGEQNIKATIQVINEPALLLSTNQLNFGSSENTLEFSISNSGGQTLEWTITESLNWLSLSSLGGTTTTETDYIQVIADRTVLSEGTHNGVISVISNGGKADIGVSIQIPAEGEWIYYDDDRFEGYYDTDGKHLFFLTQFNKPSGWAKYRISKIAISFNPSSGRDNIELFCFSTQEVQGKFYPSRSLYNTVSVDPVGGWNQWIVDWNMDIDKFCVGYRQIEEKTPSVHYDKNANIQRSYYVDTDSKGYHVSDINWAIRVYVEKSDGQPEPGKWLDIIIEPGKMTERNFSRLIQIND